MSSPLMGETFFTTEYVPIRSRSRRLKTRESITKYKCNKSLRKKLKKYKLRKDGQEDPDIIDVSQTLINSLRIKSPNNPHCLSHKQSEDNRPHNYLTKMVRSKKSVAVMESTPTKVQKCNSEIKNKSVSLTSIVDQDKKQTDAFKLLMESRNKIIGTNSPGKDRCEENSVVEEKVENKELKAKRTLSLNRMAQAKGSLKKLEIEEYRDNNIKRKMEARVERLKHMIVDVTGKHEKKDQVKPAIDKLPESSGSSVASDDIDNRATSDIKTPILKTFDLFKDMKVNLNSNVKKISKEDEEFLKKLSPSIRKKENMLCYFQKVSKESDMSQDDVECDTQHRDQFIIKVKLKSKNINSKKKIKHFTSKVTKLTENHEHDPKAPQELLSSISDSNGNSKKRKHNENIELGYEESTKIGKNTILQCYNDSRPKRSTKKPVKYSEDFYLSSSDEELHIFTPKKKRKDKPHCESSLKEITDTPKEYVKEENCNIINKVIKTKQKNCRDIKQKHTKNKDQKCLIPKQETKLAPIFVLKPSLDSAAIEARQKFLKSGVPNQLKKNSSHPTTMLGSNEFQKVVHIQCLNYIDTPVITDILNIMNQNYDEYINLKEDKYLFKKFFQVPILQNYRMPKFQTNVDQILQDIKKSFPKFPVYRTYHLLRGKCKGEFKDCIYPDLDNSVEIFNNIIDKNNLNPDKLNWVDKYKPNTEKQVIGNFESIRELRKWLVTWTENDAKSKSKKCGSDSSDFYQSDTESREIIKNENNLLIITGKVGTGKTLSVYAVAAELAIKVIEVNASTKRTGKIMLQDLQEATQSHKVDRGKNSTEYLQKSKEYNNLLTVKKKRGRKKKTNLDSVSKTIITGKESAELTASQDNIRTGMSLILIDDADIVFDQDDGFCYAISQLIQSSKRPVILVTSSLTCPHLQKFSCLAKIIKMQPFLPRMLGSWLDIMCLVDNNVCSPGLGSKILDLFKGDIRKTINYLQFYMVSHQQLSNIDNPGLLQNEEVSKVNADNENSCMSWGEVEGWGDKNSCDSNNCIYFAKKESVFIYSWKFLTNFYIWWNLPNLLNYSGKYCDGTYENLSKLDKSKETNNLNKIVSVLDNVSLTDYLGIQNEECNISSAPWLSYETDSVIDNENFAIYNRNIDCINEMSWELMIRGITEAQSVMDLENKTVINYPSMAIQRERDRVVSRHKTLTKCLNPSTFLDRRALALDYWSTCRSICRTEKSKTNNNSRRNKRFCHYLRSLNIVSKNEYFDDLGESLSFTK